jgi:tRNA modification GTPase
VGKSSLMNALLRADRVIVTPHPGTTRDVVEETINMQGLAVTLADTAGLREARDEIEQAGVERARTSIDQADLVLLVLDGAQPLQPEDRRLLAELSGPHTVVVLNKQDLGTTVEAADLPPNLPAVGVSALTGEGLDGLESAIVQQALGGVGVSGADVLVTNVRHQEALERTARALGRCAHSEAAGLTDEILAEDLRGAMDALGEITGDTSREDVIDRIFSSFCIGK